MKVILRRIVDPIITKYGNRPHDLPWYTMGGIISRLARVRSIAPLMLLLYEKHVLDRFLILTESQQAWSLWFLEEVREYEASPSADEWLDIQVCLRYAYPVYANVAPGRKHSCTPLLSRRRWAYKQLIRGRKLIL